MMTNLLIKSIDRYAPRTTSASWLVSPAMLRTRKAAVAPSQPTEKLTCAVIVNLRKAGVIAGLSFLIPWHCWRESLCGSPESGPRRKLFQLGAKLHDGTRG